MLRQIEDNDYLLTLPSEMYRKRYYRWKNNMLEQIDEIVKSLQMYPVEDVMRDKNLTPRDVALLVRLKFVTSEEADRFGLNLIEKNVPT